MNKRQVNPRFSRKSQGLSINVIIIVAIALIVLVVLIALFTGRLGGFVSGIDATGDPTKTCKAQGGEVKEGCLDTEISISSRDATVQGKLCCK